MPREGQFFILINDQRMKQAGVEAGGEVSIALDADHSEFGHNVPESFLMILDQDEEGANYFRSLSMGKQRSLVYLVTKVKNVDSQIAKGLAIMHHLKEEKGVIEFRRLNALIKEYNQRNKLGTL